MKEPKKRRRAFDAHRRLFFQCRSSCALPSHKWLTLPEGGWWMNADRLLVALFFFLATLFDHFFLDVAGNLTVTFDFHRERCLAL